MKKNIILLVTTLVLSSCNFETPTKFSEQAFNDILFSIADEKSTFKEVIHQYKGK